MRVCVCVCVCVWRARGKERYGLSAVATASWPPEIGRGEGGLELAASGVKLAEPVQSDTSSALCPWTARAHSNAISPFQAGLECSRQQHPLFWGNVGLHHCSIQQYKHTPAPLLPPPIHTFVSLLLTMNCPFSARMFNKLSASLRATFPWYHTSWANGGGG